MSQPTFRIALAALALSAAGLVGIVTSEGYVEVATPPVAGDVPTVGFGTTTHPDGSPVRAGEKTNPVKALGDALRDANVVEAQIKECVRVPLAQREYDVYVSLAYNVGFGAFCRSTIVKLLNEGRYEEACAQLKRWVYFQGKVLPGLVARREREYRQCMGES